MGGDAFELVLVFDKKNNYITYYLPRSRTGENKTEAKEQVQTFYGERSATGTPASKNQIINLQTKHPLIFYKLQYAYIVENSNLINYSFFLAVHPRYQF